MFGLLETFFRKVLQVLGDFSQLFSTVFGAVFSSRQDDGEERPSRFSFRWWGSFGLWLLLLPIYVLFFVASSPLKVFSVFSPERRRDLLLGLPALICFGLVCVVSGTVIARAGNIAGNYRTRGYQAIIDGDFERAKTFFGRVVSDSASPAKRDLFQWALVLSKTGNADRAKSIIDQLAPDDKIGFDDAHRAKALTLVSSVSESTDAKTLRHIRWHLENSGDTRSAEINQAWSLYYMTVGQPQNALKYMQMAATVNPELLISAAQITKELGDPIGHDRILRQAKDRFNALLTKDPLDHRVRIILANAEVRLDEIDEAEKLLRTGATLQPDETILKALADFFVMRHDIAVRDRGDFSEQIKNLSTALEFDPNHLPVYQRLISQSKARQETGESEEIVKLLEETIAKGESTAFAHFALSNILWMEGKQEDSQFHMEQAYRLEQRFTVIVNNLAWLLAHSEEPQLDRALDLARGVVKQAPEDARFRDTLATVLMKQGAFDEALLEFEKTLPTIQNKKPIHEKLAVIYDELKKPSMARLHREQAEKIK